MPMSNTQQALVQGRPSGSQMEQIHLSLECLHLPSTRMAKISQVSSAMQVLGLSTDEYGIWRLC